MKVGKYIISDEWKLEGECNSDIFYYHRFIIHPAPFFKKYKQSIYVSCFHNEIHFSLGANFFKDSYSQMYHERDIIFPSMDESKKRVDEFLVRLQKLKAFL